MTNHCRPADVNRFHRVESAAPALRDALKDAEVRGRAAEALGRIGVAAVPSTP